MWKTTIVDDSMSKQFNEEKGDKMSALPATVGWLSVDIPVGTVWRALAIAELSGSDTVSITISLERRLWRIWWGNSWMRLLATRRCRLMWNLVMDLGIGGGCFGGIPCEPSRR